MLTHTELSRMTGPELIALLRRISSELPDLAEGSPELRGALQTDEYPQGAGAATGAADPEAVGQLGRPPG